MQSKDVLSLDFKEQLVHLPDGTKQSHSIGHDMLSRGTSAGSHDDAPDRRQKTQLSENGRIIAECDRVFVIIQ